MIDPTSTGAGAILSYPLLGVPVAILGVADIGPSVVVVDDSGERVTLLLHPAMEARAAEIRARAVRAFDATLRRWLRQPEAVAALSGTADSGADGDAGEAEDAG